MAFNLSPENLARQCSRKPWLVIAGWLVALIIGLGLTATLLSSALTTQATFQNQPEAKRAEDLLESRLRGKRPLNEIVIFRSDNLTVDDPAFKQYVGALSERQAQLTSTAPDGHDRAEPSLL